MPPSVTQTYLNASAATAEFLGSPAVAAAWDRCARRAAHRAARDAVRLGTHTVLRAFARRERAPESVAIF